MIILIDGSNVLGGRRLDEEARRALVGRAASYARFRRARCVLFFDGTAKGNFATRLGPLTVQFTGARSADDLIVQRALAAGEPIVVVTRDSGIVSRVRGRRVTIESPSALLSFVPDQEPADANEGDWDDWFSDPANRLS